MNRHHIVCNGSVLDEGISEEEANDLDDENSDGNSDSGFLHGNTVHDPISNTISCLLSTTLNSLVPVAFTLTSFHCRRW
jgi:hypothetical protein